MPANTSPGVRMERLWSEFETSTARLQHRCCKDQTASHTRDDRGRLHYPLTLAYESRKLPVKLARMVEQATLDSSRMFWVHTEGVVPLQVR